MSWYVLFVKSGAENAVEQYLNRYFNKTECYALIPLKQFIEKKHGKRHTVVKTLFPGYVFLNATINTKMYYIIKSIPKVFKLLNYTNEHYSRICDKEMTPILKLIEKNNIIGYSKIFLDNSKVRVDSGPLKGLEGVIQKINKRKGRAKIILDIMGSQKVIEIGIEVLDKI